MQTVERRQQLHLLLPKTNLLRPAPLYRPHPQQTEQQEATEAAKCRSYVDDLRWLLQCSEVVLEGPQEGVRQLEGREETQGPILAALEQGASKSGLGLRLYMAQGQRCQR